MNDFCYLWRKSALVAVWSLFVAGLLPVQKAAALTITSTTSDNGLSALSVQWTDSEGNPRTAIMVKASNSGAYQGPGYLRRMTYEPTTGTTRVCTGTDNIEGETDEFSGDGFVQNHAAYGFDDGSDFSDANYGDPSDPDVPGTTTTVLDGASHAIIEFDMPTYPIGDTTVPTSIQWFFADGRDHPIFAISQDARAMEETSQMGNLSADSRSPYGDMAYDGDGTDAYVGGASYGDTYKFVTLASDPEEVTTNSGWTDTEANTIPYAMQWANPAQANAEMGHVATLPGSVYDQGEDCSAAVTVDPRTMNVPNGPMLEDQAWGFQILNYQWPSDGAGTPITEKRLTWGRNFGSVGGFDEYDTGNPYGNYTTYNQHWTDPVGEALSGTPANGMLLAYSVFVVFGTHNGSYASGAVAQQITQMENVAVAALTTSTGTKQTTGPAGIGNAANATITYSPAGYNPTYAAWEISASANAVNATLTPAASHSLSNPVFIIDNFTKGSLPSSISVTASGSSPSYYASLDTANSRLWITATTPSAITSTTPLHLVVSEVPPPTITMFTPTSGTVGTTVTLTGTSFTGATAVAFNGVNATTFNVTSATSMTAKVPNGATTGTISVTTTSTGTGSSTSDFSPLYTLSVVAEPSSSDGTVTAGGISGGGSLAGGTQTIVATANAGFVFNNWTLGGTPVSTTPSFNITLNTNETFDANFLATYTLTVNNLTPSDGSVSGGGTFVSGSTPTVTATPFGGYVFSNWSVNGIAVSTSASYNVPLVGPVTIDATFAQAPTPQIEVLNGTNVITNGQTDAVSFGSVQQNQTGPTLTFTVTNSGGQPLDLGTPTVPSGYNLTGAPPATIAAGNSGSFSVQLDSAMPGINSGNITISNNANNATNVPFIFPITGLVTTEIISLTGNLAFGGVALGSSSNRTLTIANNGDSTLTVSNITYPAGFAGAWSGTIGAGSSQAVTVTFSPTIASNYTGTATISSDATGGTDAIPISGYGASGTLVLTVITNGDGSVSPDRNGQTLTAGVKYTLKAVPGLKQIFAGWTGSTNSTKNPLTFTMEPSTVLQANFITNPFLTLNGTYNGLFSTSNGVTEETAGMLKGLAVTQKGTYSGVLLINGASHTITGSFDASGQSSNYISRTIGQGGPLVVEMTLANSSNPAPQVTGTISNSSWVANLTADLGTNTVPSAEYTMLLLPDPNNTPPTNSPGGDGYALVTNKAGAVTITGALADGAALNQMVPVSEDGYVPVFASLYGGKGLLLGWVNLVSTNAAGVGLTWIRPGIHPGLYQNGFTNILLTNQIPLSPWTNSTANFENLTNLSTLDTFTSTNSVLTNVALRISSAGKITITGSSTVVGSITPKTGAWTVTVGKGTSSVTGHGAILLDEMNGGGYFLTTKYAGAIELAP